MARAIGTEKPLTQTTIGDAADIITLMFKKHLFLLACTRVHHDEGRTVAIDVGKGIDIAIVEGEKRKGDFLLKMGGQDGAEGFILRLAIKHLHIHPIDDGIDHTQDSGVVSGPALPITWILCQKRQLTSDNIQTIGVESLGIATIEGDEHFVRTHG